MKSLGVTRPLDKLHRIVIPRELCRTFDLKPDDRVTFFTDADSIIIRKHRIHCEFCTSIDGLIPFGGKFVCRHCRDDMKKRYGE